MLNLRIFPPSSAVKNLPEGQGTWVWFKKIPWEKEMATRSSILACRILWTEEPGKLQFMGSQELDMTWQLNHQHHAQLIYRRHSLIIFREIRESQSENHRNKGNSINEFYIQWKYPAGMKMSKDIFIWKKTDRIGCQQNCSLSIKEVLRTQGKWYQKEA